MTLQPATGAPAEVAEFVPFVSLAPMHSEIAHEVGEGFERVLAATAFVGGPDVAAFEREFADYSGRSHCVGVANGTDAIELVLRGIGIGPGDEVIVPANTFVATAEAVARAGATVVACDVQGETLLMDAASAESRITDRTKAIVPVHLYGQMADMRSVRELAERHGVAVVEDAAQAQGASQGGASIGAGSVAAATSFYPGKNLGAYGDAGAVLCDDDQLAARVRRIGSHGSDRKYVHEEFGFNSRLDTLQAVVLRAKLRRLEVWNEQRRVAARLYSDLLSDCALDDLRIVPPVTAPDNVHVWHLYVVRVPNRDDVLTLLAAQGIGAGIHYPVPVHRQPAFSGAAAPGQCPVSERTADEILSLPMFPGMTPDQQERVVEALRVAVASSLDG